MATGPSAAALLFVVGLLVGVFLVYRGIRGVPTLSDPKCSKCGYDLRWVKPEVHVVCPECGADLKAPRAVRFADHQRRPRLILIGSLILLAAVAVPTGLRITAGLSRPPSRATTPTRVLVASLATSAGQPWDWNELNRRLAAGQMTGQDVVGAIDQLINHLTTKANAGREPLHWSGSFVANADQAGLILNEQFGRLAIAFHGPAPKVSAHTRVRQGKPLAFTVQCDGPWNLAGWRMIWAIRRVTLDAGRELAVLDPARPEGGPVIPELLSGTGDWPIHGRMLLDAPVGKHTLTFDMDMGLVAESVPFRTASERPGQADRWPKPRCKWSRSVTVNVEVIGPGGTAVELVTDAKLDPAQKDHLTATGVVYPLSEQACTLDLTFTAKDLRVPLAFKVTVRARGQDFPCQPIKVDTQDRDGTWKYRQAVRTLPRDINTVDLILAPDAELVGDAPGFDRIWGKDIVLRDVRLQREDLEDPGVPASSSPSSAAFGSF
ncbi:MAG: hypothetical protein KA354_21040 [Phycisphaerae bacterium]|nr:hypothetical protein [Phycisphaerae bacterium]